MRNRQPRDWMWADACERLEQLDRLKQQFFHVGTSSTSRPTWEPPVDIIETTDEVGIIIALPGVEPERTEVSVDGDTLVIGGNRPMPDSYRAAHIQRLEIPHGRFERRLRLPWARLALARSDHVNGCLLIVLRKLA